MGEKKEEEECEDGICKPPELANIKPTEKVKAMPGVRKLAKEKGIVCVEIPQKDTLGAAVGLSVGCAAVAVIKEGDAKALIKEINESSNNESSKAE